jgi:hypothetical protein
VVTLGLLATEVSDRVRMYAQGPRGEDEEAASFFILFREEDIGSAAATAASGPKARRGLLDLRPGLSVEQLTLRPADGSPERSPYQAIPGAGLGIGLEWRSVNILIYTLALNLRVPISGQRPVALGGELGYRWHPRGSERVWLSMAVGLAQEWILDDLTASSPVLRTVALPGARIGARVNLFATPGFSLWAGAEGLGCFSRSVDFIRIRAGYGAGARLSAEIGGDSSRISVVLHASELRYDAVTHTQRSTSGGLTVGIGWPFDRDVRLVEATPKR